MPKNLNKNLARARAKPAPAKKQPIPRLDDTPERIARAIEQAQAGNMVEVVSILKQILQKEVTVEVDAAAIGDAVGEQIANMPTPEVKMQPREPLSYTAKVLSRNRNGDMVTARIDPITE